MPLTSFEKGKLKIAAHVREELDRAGIGFESIRCRSGGTQTHRDTSRVTVTVDGHSMHLDLNAHEVEECELLVMGDTWRKIAGFIERLKYPWGGLQRHGGLGTSAPRQALEIVDIYTALI